MLKAKIQQRPPREELERRHILEADVAPSLAERQRMLKKARLADQLNDQLSHRPGPLELIRKNILHTEPPIDDAVKAGRIPYRATCEGQLTRPQHPQAYVTPEDDSQSSEGGDTLVVSPDQSAIVVSLLELEAAPIVLINKDSCATSSSELFPAPNAVLSPASLVSSTSTLSPLSSIPSPVAPVSTPVPPPLPVTLTPRPLLPPAVAKSDAPGKDKNRKKSKSKSATPKARTIKFHEYKGPPSAQKSASCGGASNAETSYDLLLQQQTLLLQFQLQLQHKYPQIILPAQPQPDSASTSAQSQNQPSPANSATTTAAPAGQAAAETSRLLVRLEDMKVSDLKAELKRRSLPVSGSKPQLIQRLKPYADQHHQESSVSSTNMHMDDPHASPKQELGSPPQTSLDLDEQMDVTDPLSPPELVAEKTQEDIVREQQRRIEELQRELTLSQIKLQAATRGETKTRMLPLQKHIQARQQQQMAVQIAQLQDMQARQERQRATQEQQRIQQQQHVAFQNQKNLANNASGAGLLLNSSDAALILNQLNLLQQGKAKLVNGHQRANSLPSFVGSIVVASQEIKAEPEDVKPPPLYEDVARTKKEKSGVKSQIVDDVLDILIKNGELPPSAAQDPGSAGSRSNEPIFPTNNNVAKDALPTTDNLSQNLNLNLNQNQNENQNQNQNQSENENQNQNHNHLLLHDPSSPGQDPTNLGIDTADLLESLDSLEGMDFNQLVMELGHQPASEGGSAPVPMDTDEWLESLLPRDNGNSLQIAPLAAPEPDLGGYDPLLGIGPGPFDPFYLEEYRSGSDLNGGSSLSWDKLDFAA